MNISSPSTQLRQHEPQDFVAFTPVSVIRGTSKNSDSLPMISIIVAIFVLVAIFIILVVHYGPQLRTTQITLHHEPMPQHLESGVHLTNWKKLGSQRKSNVPSTQDCWRDLGRTDGAGLSFQCSCKHHLPCGNAEPSVIEITYL